MRYLTCITLFLSTLRFGSDTLYELSINKIHAGDVYNSIRYLECASVLNPSSVIIAQLERMMIKGSFVGQRLLFFHPNDYDALILMTEDLRIKGQKQEARKYLFKASKADPYYSQANNYEMSLLQ